MRRSYSVQDQCRFLRHSVHVQRSVCWRRSKTDGMLHQKFAATVRHRLQRTFHTAELLSISISQPSIRHVPYVHECFWNAFKHTTDELWQHVLNDRVLSYVKSQYFHSCIFQCMKFWSCRIFHSRIFSIPTSGVMVWATGSCKDVQFAVT